MERLVSYGCSKQAPRRLEITIFPRAAGKCAFYFSLLLVFGEDRRVCRFITKSTHYLHKTIKIATSKADITPEVREVVIRGIHCVLQRAYSKMCIL